MKKIFFLAATAALALSSCSSDEELVQSPDLNGDVAVSFDNYLQRSGRGTHITTTASVKKEGFGVFAYDHAQAPVETYTNSYIAPNFFSNEKVTFSTTPDPDRWVYANTKYWPNNPGNMLSFYAYAPYDANIKPGYAESNPRLILNGDYNGPALYYKLPTDLAQTVDLCWGAEYGLDKAPVNKTKPSISTDIKFNLKHALSRYGFNVQVFSDNMTDNYPNDTDHDPNGITNNGLTATTTIYIKSLKLVGNFCTEGTLSLYNGKWDCDIANTAEYELKGFFHPNVADGITAAEAVKEIPLFKNEECKVDPHTGDAEKEDYVMLLPGSRFKILIEYDVVTKDPNLLPPGESRTKNVILSEEEFEAQAGVATDFHLNLGMTTVKFDAVVTDWNVADKEEVDLPNNTLEDVSVIDDVFFWLPGVMDGNFLGNTTVVPEAKAENHNKYYYNTKEEKLYMCTSDGTSYKWENCNAIGENWFIANSYLYKVAADGKCTVKPAPRWINIIDGSWNILSTHLLVNGAYQPITLGATVYESVEALALANPDTAIYSVGNAEKGYRRYYYKHQPTNNFGQN